MSFVFLARLAKRHESFACSGRVVVVVRFDFFMEENSFDIVVGCMADVAAVARFQVDMAMESEGTVLNVGIVERGVSAVMCDSAKGMYLVAKAGGTAVASLMITREWSDWNNEWYWWVQSVYVTPEYRGKGIYRKMYAKVKELAGKDGVSQIRLYVDKTNVRARRVYEKLGMQECHYLMYDDCVEL